MYELSSQDSDSGSSLCSTTTVSADTPAYAGTALETMLDLDVSSELNVVFFHVVDKQGLTARQPFSIEDSSPRLQELEDQEQSHPTAGQSPS